LRNGSAIPLSIQVAKFTFRVSNWDNPLVGTVALEDIAPGQTKGWYRHPMSIPIEDLPADVVIAYDIHHGRYQRSHAGI